MLARVSLVRKLKSSYQTTSQIIYLMSSQIRRGKLQGRDRRGTEHTIIQGTCYWFGEGRIPVSQR